MSMIAKVTKAEQSNAKNMNSQKEIIGWYIVVGCNDKGEIVEGVECRVYMGRSRNASTVYASIWVQGSVWASGHGSAGGGGYHKESAAIAEAIESAGITLYGSAYSHDNEEVDYTRVAHIGGVGDEAVKEALIAIARDIVGLSNCKVV